MPLNSKEQLGFIESSINGFKLFIFSLNTDTLFLWFEIDKKSKLKQLDKRNIK